MDTPGGRIHRTHLAIKAIRSNAIGNQMVVPRSSLIISSFAKLASGRACDLAASVLWSRSLVKYLLFLALRDGLVAPVRPRDEEPHASPAPRSLPRQPWPVSLQICLAVTTPPLRCAPPRISVSVFSLRCLSLMSFNSFVRRKISPPNSTCRLPL